MSNGSPKGFAKGLIAIVVIVIAGFLLLNMKFRWVDLKFFGGRDNPALPRDLKVLAIDIDDHKLYPVVQKKGDSFPLENPNTGQRTLWRAYVCDDEKILFPAKPGTMTTKCPFCPCIRVGGASEEHKDYEIRIPEGL